MIPRPSQPITTNSSAGGSSSAGDSLPVGSGAHGRPTSGHHLCRRDALTGHWVIFAPGRNERPSEIVETELPNEHGHNCPFCAGNEEHTPPATFSIRESATEYAQWTVRVVPNLFPAVLSADDLQRLIQTGGSPALSPVQMSQRSSSREDAIGYSTGSRGGTPINDDSHWNDPLAFIPSQSNHLFQSCDLYGGHEVIVETPQHVESLTALSPEHAGRVFEAYAERMRHWFAARGIEYVVVFKNVGAAAGASLRHTHSQLVATSLLPPAVRRMGRRVNEYLSQTKRCLLCAMLEGELAADLRIFAQTERFVAYCPFASRLPYLVRIVPRHHHDRFELQSAVALHELAGLAQEILRAMESLFAQCAYNFTIHSRPRHGASVEAFHWWMEIFPRLTKVAGFEWGSDCFINPITPEAAASQLRKTKTSTSTNRQ